MNLGKFARVFSPVLALAAAGALSACGDVNVDYETDGVPLAELGLSGDPPTGLVVAGSDTVSISAGDDFTVEVTGEDEVVEQVRFALDDEILVVHRADGWNGAGSATVNITVPSLESIVVAGSGTVSTNALGSNVSMVMTGSGSIEALSLEAESIDVVIPGSGTIIADGTAGRLSATIIGSGDAEMEGLQVDQAELTIIGSGDAIVSSDGRVEATFIGSGDVRVVGDADCEANTIGSGDLICEPA